MKLSEVELDARSNVTQYSDTGCRTQGKRQSRAHAAGVKGVANGRHRDGTVGDVQVARKVVVAQQRQRAGPGLGERPRPADHTSHGQCVGQYHSVGQGAGVDGYLQAGGRLRHGATAEIQVGHQAGVSEIAVPNLRIVVRHGDAVAGGVVNRATVDGERTAARAERA